MADWPRSVGVTLLMRKARACVFRQRERAVEMTIVVRVTIIKERGALGIFLCELRRLRRVTDEAALFSLPMLSE